MRKIIAVFGLITSLVYAQTERQKIAVYKFSSDELSKSQTSEISKYITNELRNYSQFEVMDWSNVGQILGFVNDQEQLANVAKDPSKAECASDRCFTELGNRLGVDLMVVGSANKIGSRYLVNISLQDIENVRMISTSTTQIRGDLGDILDSIPSMMRRMIPTVTVSSSAGVRKAGISSSSSVLSSSSMVTERLSVAAPDHAVEAQASGDHKFEEKRSNSPKMISYAVNFGLASYAEALFGFRTQFNLLPWHLGIGVGGTNLASLTGITNYQVLPLIYTGLQFGPHQINFEIGAQSVGYYYLGDDNISSIELTYGIHYSFDLGDAQEMEKLPFHHLY